MELNSKGLTFKLLCVTELLKIMEKEKIRFICFLLASVCFFIVSIMNFMDENTAPAITFLLLGISFLLLSTTHLKKDK